MWYHNAKSTLKKIADKLATIELEENEEIISFDIVSLYTNVPVEEAIEVCTDLLYSGEHQLHQWTKRLSRNYLSCVRVMSLCRRMMDSIGKQMA